MLMSARARGGYGLRKLASYFCYLPPTDRARPNSSKIGDQHGIMIPLKLQICHYVPRLRDTKLS